MKVTDRKFDMWEWRDESTAPKALNFEVRCERPLNVAEGPIRYYIKHADPPIAVESGDLGPLRDKLDAAVRAFYKIDWHPVLVVQTKKEVPTHRQAPSFEVTLESVSYERGMFNGAPVHRVKRPNKEGAGNFTYAMKQGDIAREFRPFGSAAQSQRQWVLPDTPAMREMLQRFDAAVLELFSTMLGDLEAASTTPVPLNATEPFCS